MVTGTQNYCQGKDVTIHFGELQCRPSVFLPNLPGNSIDRGWWPGSLRNGFHFNMLYSNVQIEMGPKAKENSLQFIKDKTFINLQFLHDLLGTVLYIHDNGSPPIRFQFNPDSMQLIFGIQEVVEQKDKRIVLKAWDGEETLQSQMFDLVDNQFCMWKLPFYPTKIGYQLYEIIDQQWKLVKQHSSYLIHRIHINMDITVGKLVVKKGDETEEHDITIRQEPIKTGSSSSEQPWIDAERQRLKINKGVEIRQLGSLFLPYKGGSSHQESWQLIVNELLKKAEQRIWIWDPFLDESILDELFVLGLKKQTLDIKLLLSEFEGEKTGEDKQVKRQDDDSIEVKNSSFPRCTAINNYFAERNESLEALKRFEVRNWYRSGKHTFHDRFIIIDDFVWSIGSSLKDIGNYHTTIYRLEGDLPEQVIEEFKNGWEGHFGHMKPRGLFIFPDWRLIPKGEQNE